MKKSPFIFLPFVAVIIGCGKEAQHFTPIPTILGKWIITRTIETSYQHGLITARDTFNFDGAQYVVFEPDHNIQTSFAGIIPDVTTYNIGPLQSYSLNGNIITYKFASSYSSSDTIKILTIEHLVTRHLFDCYKCSPTGEFNVIDENDFSR